jgi:hypothetical protein
VRPWVSGRHQNLLSILTEIFFSPGQPLSKCLCENLRKKERHNMYNGQMELSLENGKLCPSLTRRQRRMSRAQWWFQRMRQVVDRVIDPPAAPRPEQMVFAGAHRKVSIGPEPPQAEGFAARPMTERQICE